MVGFKDFHAWMNDRVYWERELYRTMRQIGIQCRRKYEPEWKKIDGDKIQPFHRYELINTEKLKEVRKIMATAKKPATKAKTKAKVAKKKMAKKK